MSKRVTQAFAAHELVHGLGLAMELVGAVSKSGGIRERSGRYPSGSIFAKNPKLAAAVDSAGWHLMNAYRAAGDSREWNTDLIVRKSRRTRERAVQRRRSMRRLIAR